MELRRGFSLIRPELALADHCADGKIVVLRRISVFLEEALDHLAHLRSGRSLLLPVDGAVLAKEGSRSISENVT